MVPVANLRQAKRLFNRTPRSTPGHRIPISASLNSAPWDLLRDEAYFTDDGQRAGIQDVLLRYSQGITVPHVILDQSCQLVGRITLNGIVRGPLQSCSVGYWVGAAHNGRGLATAAVGDILRVAFDDLGLHRVQAETLLDNFVSQKVLARNGFVRFGLAPQYLNIAGRWQDHIMFQVINPAYTIDGGDQYAT